MEILLICYCYRTRTKTKRSETRFTGNRFTTYDHDRPRLIALIALFGQMCLVPDFKYALPQT